MRSKTAWIVLSFTVALGLLISSTAGLADTPTPQPGPSGQSSGPFPPSPVAPAVETTQSTPANNQPEAIDCIQAITQGVEKQLNMRAALIRVQCGLEKPGVTTPENLEESPATASNANNYGGTDVQVNNALADTHPHDTQSETFIAANANVVIVAYNSSTGAPGNLSGISYSTNGGSTFTEIRPSPFATGHGTNYGDPVALYNSKYGSWITVWITTGGDCGPQGLGSWTSSNGVNWSVGACVHVGRGDDRPSGWADNNPSSPYYGNMYVSWNDFSTSRGDLVASVSTDGGSSWSTPVTVYSTSTFRMRDAQMTGGQDGTAFIVGMDEGGGGANPRHNYIFRSVNGGANWTSAISMGASFPAPGDIQCTPYFRAVTPIWRFMGYGEPAVGPGGVVHYVYTAGSGGVDTGDTYYVRSTDNGDTWSAPVKLNTDATTRTQWMPSLAVTVNGKVMASWYDRRNTSNNDYQRYARISLDNGATWQPDQPISDQVIPQPAQPDHNLSACYAGDYDYSSSTGQTIYSAWTDGRIKISGYYQQDVYLDKVDFSTTRVPVCTAPGAYGWSAVGALPTAVYSPGVTSDDNFVYAAGGYNFSLGAVNQFTHYSPASNTWTPLLPMPAPAYVTTAVHANGKVYVFGGLDATNTVVNITRIYTIATNSWSAGAPMPDVRQQMGGGYYNGKIYLVGGYSGFDVNVANTQNQTWAYDIASNTWSTLASLPAPLGGPGSAVVGSHLYILGGRDPSHTALNTVYDYDILANTWTSRSPMLSAVNAPGSATRQDKIWVMGGGTPFLSANQSVPGAGEVQPQAVETTGITQIYDPGTNTWSIGPTQVYPRSFQGVATAQGVVVSVGGFDGNSSAVTEVPIQRPLRILVVFADSIQPGTVQNALLPQPGVSVVDMFDAHIDTPTLPLLKGYDEVVTFSHSTYADPAAIGNVLADYVDAGGVVVELNFGVYVGWAIQGRWVSGGYSPFNNTNSTNFTDATWSITAPATNPLLFGVNDLASLYRLNVVIAPGSTQVAQWSDALPLLAIKGRAVGINAYLGQAPPNWSGDFARMLINAGFSLRSNRNICWRLTLPVMVRNH